jgi:peptidoglycan/xylan/chitin deacetylase (PgdA/CDA1 family)
MAGRRLARFFAPFERRLWPNAPVVLMYHRVALLPHDPWNLAVEPWTFAEQIEALKSVREVVPLGELVARMKRPKSPQRPLAAVTFDDGYQDVFMSARPVLHRQDCPATVFLTTAMIGSERNFWWDELARIVLGAPRLPPSISQDPDPEPQARKRMCFRLRRKLRHLAPAEIARRLDVLSGEAGVDRIAPEKDRAMTAEQVGRLSDGLVTIGAHTLNHPSLPHLSPIERQAEIGQSRRACEAYAGGPVEHFAYPFGYFDGASVHAVRRAGFASASTTAPSVVRPGADPLRLPRLAPGRRDGEALLKMLAGG